MITLFSNQNLGVPDWAIPEEQFTMEFPLPIAEPSSLEYDPTTGYPNISSCLQRTFSDYYFTSAVGEGFQCLYNNTDNLQDYFVQYWEQVATTFADSPYVLGYELINEPVAIFFIIFSLANFTNCICDFLVHWK